MDIVLTNQMKMWNNFIMYSLFGKGGEARELLWDMESDLSSLAFEFFSTVWNTSVLIEHSQLFSVFQCLRVTDYNEYLI